MSNNCNCSENANDCGCKITTDEIVYQGPELGCTEISNCDTLTEVLIKLDALICGTGLTQTVINNIITDTTINNEFVTVVNSVLDCDVLYDCISQTTTTTTTFLVEDCSVCDSWFFEAFGENLSRLTYIDCNTELKESIPIVFITENSGTICVKKNTTPEWEPAPNEGTHILGKIGCCDER
jgi:hypothetical protein